MRSGKICRQLRSAVSIHFVDEWCAQKGREIQPDVAVSSPSFSDFAAKCARSILRPDSLWRTAHEQRLPERRHDPPCRRPYSGAGWWTSRQPRTISPSSVGDLFDEGDRVRRRPGIDVASKAYASRRRRLAATARPLTVAKERIWGSALMTARAVSRRSARRRLHPGERRCAGPRRCAVPRLIVWLARPCGSGDERPRRTSRTRSAGSYSSLADGTAENPTGTLGALERSEASPAAHSAVTDAAETPPDVVGPRDHLQCRGQSTTACTHLLRTLPTPPACAASRASLVGEHSRGCSPVPRVPRTRETTGGSSPAQGHARSR